MKSCPKIRLYLFLCFFVAGPALALQPLVTDDTGTQDLGHQQLEWSFTRDRELGAAGASVLREQAVVYTYGLSERLDLYVAAVHSNGSSTGWGNPVLGAKWRFLEHGSSSWAIKPELAWPLSVAQEGRGLGTGQLSGTVTLIMSQELPWGAVHFNAGLGEERFRPSAGENTRYTRFSVAPVWNVAPDWKLTLDMGEEQARAASTTRTRFAQLGVIWSLREDLDWAAAWLSSRDNAASATQVNSFTTGLTWRF